MAILTAEQKTKYLESQGAQCPFCGDSDISGGSINIESGQAWQNLTCGACGEHWRDVYTLAAVETDEELDTLPATPKA